MYALGKIFLILNGTALKCEKCEKCETFPLQIVDGFHNGNDSKSNFNIIIVLKGASFKRKLSIHFAHLVGCESKMFESNEIHKLYQACEFIHSQNMPLELIYS